MSKQFEAGLNQITNNPMLLQMYKDTMTEYVEEALGDEALPFDETTRNAMLGVGTTDEARMVAAIEYPKKPDQLTDRHIINTSNITDISGIFNNIHDNIDNTAYFDKKNIANNEDVTGNMVEKAFVMYYENINNLKSIRHDISYNINTANKFLHRLHNYTNTNPNLHLLSKTKDKLQNKINSYEKHMNIDSKMNKEFEKNIENNKKYNYYLIIIYYVILILFFIFSNFMKNKYYKNPIANIMIILYIIAPFIIKYIILYLYKIYLYIMKKFNLLNTGLTYEDIIKYDSYNYENNQDNISYI